MIIKVFRQLLLPLLVINLSMAQHQVPVGSIDNKLILTVNNISQAPLPIVSLTLVDAPSWIMFDSSQTFLHLLSGFTHEDVQLTFSVASSVPLGEQVSMVFKLRSVRGDEWLKQVELVTTAPQQGTSLIQNYPNPFNPTTNFSFQIANFGFVTLKIFDMLGREVAVLVNEQKSIGSYNVQWDASKLASGIYISRLTVNPQAEPVNGASRPIMLTKKLLLIK